MLSNLINTSNARNFIFISDSSNNQNFKPNESTQFSTKKNFILRFIHEDIMGEMIKK
jgi:hypothetical protein